MIGIQILAIIFALWMIYFTNLHFRRKEFTRTEFLFWMVLWVGLMLVVLFPGTVGFVLKAFSISRTFDLVVIVGIIVLFGVTFRNYVLLRRLEKRLEMFVRTEALDKDRITKQ